MKSNYKKDLTKLVVFQWLVQCGPDEDCVLNEDANGAVCVPRYGKASSTQTPAPTPRRRRAGQ